MLNELVPMKCPSPLKPDSTGLKRRKKKQYSYKHTHIHVALYSVPLKIMLQQLDYCRFDMQTRVARN